MEIVSKEMASNGISLIIKEIASLSAEATYLTCLYWFSRPNGTVCNQFNHWP